MDPYEEEQPINRDGVIAADCSSLYPLSSNPRPQESRIHLEVVLAKTAFDRLMDIHGFDGLLQISLVQF
jgi:hypothetical protein